MKNKTKSPSLAILKKQAGIARQMTEDLEVAIKVKEDSNPSKQEKLPEPEIKKPRHIIKIKSLVIRKTASGEPAATTEWLEEGYGPVWQFEGRPHYLMVARNGTYEPYIPSDEIQFMSPEKLYRTSLWEAAKRRLGYHSTFIDKVNMWATVGLVGILLFVIVLLLGELGKL